MPTPYIFVSIVLLAAPILHLLYKRFFLKEKGELDHNALIRQPLFWAAICWPLAAFFFFGGFVWEGKVWQLDSDGYQNFIDSSKLPLALLALSGPFVAIVVSMHRSVQTAK